ncbi:MAG TPA: NAD-dependent epimerase/dehydratase family protein [Verrucomicrobiae bacterium]|nr:NAD-dependent epimerase/dehydratase family protein [Verrucomicrobiae bacterium]
MAPANRDLVFLTGGSGFVGAHVLRALLAAGYRVRALARGPMAPLDGCEIVSGDLRRSGTLAHALDGCRYLVHCAAQYSFGPRDREAIRRTNVLGTEGLFAAADLAGVERAVLTSSSATLGGETHVFTSGDLDYHGSKIVQERAAFASRLPTVAVLPTAPVGPGDVKPTPTGAMIVDFMRGKMIARPPASGGINLVDVEQVAQAHVAALERGAIGERYVIGGENFTFDALWDLLAELTGRAAPRVRAPVALMYAAAWVDEARCRMTGATPFVPLEGVRMSQRRMFVDSAAAADALGVAVRPVFDALVRAIVWYRDHGYAA